MHSGVYCRSELLALGADDADIRRWVASGALTRLRPGWLARDDAHPQAVAAVRRGGALTCVSALDAQGAWIPPGYGDLHVRASRHGLSAGSGFCRGFSAPRPITTAIDTVPLALEYAARCMAPDDWVAACDSVLNTQQISVAELAAEMSPVSVCLRDLLDRCDPRSQSGTETLVRLRLRSRGFAVVTQPQIPGVGRADLRVGRLLIECDSRSHHTDLDAYRTDRHRDRAALTRGWMTMRLTYDDVLFGWDQVLTEIRAITDADRHRTRRNRTQRELTRDN